MKPITTLIALITLPGMALAHGDVGHGLMANLEHILSSAAHLWPLAVTAVAAAAVKHPVQRLLRQRVNHKD